MEMNENLKVLKLSEIISKAFSRNLPVRFPKPLLVSLILVGKTLNFGIKFEKTSLKI
jgi:hypothetical protein